MSVTIFDTISNYFEDYSLYVGSNEVELLVDVKSDISTANDFLLHVIYPENIGTVETPITEATWIGTLKAQTTNVITYTIKSTDIPIPGVYKIYAHVKWDATEDDEHNIIPAVEFLGESALLRIRRPGE
ncbi:MAG: hypothetical protein EHM87_23425 [Burkholderiales bacterium]|nr:MAG: hypothetical protein EHM87_23425 [Burkholderiales bacterium]